MFVLKKKTEENFRWQTSHRHLHSVERQPEGVQLVEGARRRTSSEGAPWKLRIGNYRPLELCLRLVVEAEGSIPIRFEMLVLVFLFLQLGLLILFLSLNGSLTPPAPPQDGKSSKGGTGTFPNGWFVVKGTWIPVSLNGWRGFCFSNSRC